MLWMGWEVLKKNFIITTPDQNSDQTAYTGTKLDPTCCDQSNKNPILTCPSSNTNAKTNANYLL